ncbi:hypothetical protein HBI73_072400 [Parastagonospora nodorum]|nr:hypothetical protein HBI73_072400 [Parastagonospora nodorum]
MLRIYYIVSKEYKKLVARLRIVEIKNYAKRNSTVFIMRDYTIIKLTRLKHCCYAVYLLNIEERTAFYAILPSTILSSRPVSLNAIGNIKTLDERTKCIRIADARRIVRGLENSASASLLVYSNYALQEYSLLKVTAVYALNYLELRVLKLTCFLSANIIALIGTVLYNAIKEYYDDRMRKIIYFYSYTIENNYNAIYDYYDNDVDNILIKYIDNKQQRYNILIEDYNCAGKREDNILTIDKCRTGYSNEEDIEADEREEETRVRLRELLEEIHDILLREFCRANDFTESVTHNDDDTV